MDAQPIDIHYTRLQDWLTERKSVLGRRDGVELEILREDAGRLMRLGKFEVPSLKHQVQRLRTKAAECSRRIEESFSHERLAGLRLADILADLGLNSAVAAGGNGSDIDGELDCALTRNLTSMGEHITRFTEGLLPQCLDALTTYVQDAHTLVSCMSPEVVPEALFPTLMRIREIGSEPSFHPDRHTNRKGDESGIDWGVGIQEITPTSHVLQVDWNLDDAGGSPNEIQEIAFTDLESLLHSPEARGAAIDEIVSLVGFLKESAREPDNHSVGENVLTMLPRRLRHGKLAEEVENTILQVFRDPIRVRLLRASTDADSRLRLLDTVRRAYTKAKGFAGMRECLEHEERATLQEMSVLEPAIQTLVDEVRLLRDACERRLGILCVPRPVYIVGDINGW